MTAITPILEARRLLLPETAWWHEDFIAEVTSFPAGAHDDWCDALAMAINHLQDNVEPNMLTYYRFLNAARAVDDGSGVAETARRFNLDVQELEAWLTRPRPGAVMPANGFDTLATKLIEAHRCRDTILIDSDQYKRVRPQLLASSDPKAAAMVREYDRKFGLFRA